MIVGGFIVNFMRNSKEIDVLKVMPLFEMCKSSKVQCNHKFAGLIPVLDNSIPDFIEETIENVGWKFMLDRFMEIEYLEQFKLLT